MAEYIEREELLEAIKEFRLNETMSKHLTREDCETARNAIERAQMVIECIPAAYVEPVRNGRWIAMHDEFCSCSLCKYPVYGSWCQTKYCPNCGARMYGSE